jgi:hypothetical protein
MNNPRPLTAALMRQGDQLLRIMRPTLKSLEGQTHPAAVKRRRDIERTIKRIEAVLARGAHQPTENPHA